MAFRLSGSRSCTCRRQEMKERFDSGAGAAIESNFIERLARLTSCQCSLQVLERSVEELLRQKIWQEAAPLAQNR